MDGESPDRVAVDQKVIRIYDQQYWLYAAVDPATNNILHSRLSPTYTIVIAEEFLAEVTEKYDVDDAVCLIDGSHSPNHACRRQSFDFRYERHGNRSSVERVLREIQRRTTSVSNCFSNAGGHSADKGFRSFAFAWNQLI